MPNCTVCNKSYKRDWKPYKDHVKQCVQTLPVAVPCNEETVSVVLLVKEMLRLNQNVEQERLRREEERLRREEEKEQERLRREEERLRREEEKEQERLRREEEKEQERVRWRQEVVRREQERLRREEEREQERLRREEEREQERLRWRQEVVRREEEREQERLRREEERFRREDEREQERTRLLAEQVSIQRETLDFHRSVYSDCRSERASYLKEKAARFEHVNNRPRLLSASSVCQKGELLVYGTVADPWFRTSAVKSYMKEALLDSVSEFGPVSAAVDEFLDAVSFEEEVLVEGAAVCDTYLPVSQWEECSLVMEEVMECPPALVMRHLRNLECHLPYSPYCEVQEYVFPTDRLFHALPRIPDKTGYAEAGKSLTDAKDADEDPIVDQTLRGEESTASILITAHRKEVVRGRLKRYVEKNRKGRGYPTVLNFVGYNRARLHILHSRLKRNGVYLPDFMERYRQDQEFKKRNEGVFPVRKRMLMEKRFPPGSVSHCEICGKGLPMKELEVGHVVPAFRKGGIPTVGSTLLHNLVASCVECNRATGSMDGLLSGSLSMEQVLMTKRVR